MGAGDHEPHLYSRMLAREGDWTRTKKELPAVDVCAMVQVPTVSTSPGSKTHVQGGQGMCKTRIAKVFLQITRVQHAVVTIQDAIHCHHHHKT